MRKLILSLILGILLVQATGLFATARGTNFPAGKQILIINDPTCPGSAVGVQALTKLGITSFTAVSPAQFATTNLNLFDVLYVSILVLENSACQNILTALNTRSSDIAAFVMSGHGIAAEDEGFLSGPPSAAPAPFGWLPAPVTTAAQGIGAFGDNVAIVTPSPVFTGLTSATLSNWAFSFHCQFTSTSSAFTTFAIGTSTAFGSLPITLTGFGRVVITCQDPSAHFVENIGGAVAAGILLDNMLTFAATGPPPPPPTIVGRVCIVPGESTACPQTLPALRGSGGPLNVSINILGSTTFNAFDIQVRWDFTVMNSTSVDLTGTILPTPTTTRQCINGVGFGCGLLDGPGVAHVAMTGGNTTAPASGRLFKIVFFFAVNGVTLSVGFQTGCSTNSVPNTNVCVLIATGPATNPGITPVSEGIQSQLLGVPLPTPIGSLGGNIIDLVSGGSNAPNFADTYVMPFPVTLPGNITTWKVQFRPTTLSIGLVDPMGVQIKVLRKTSATTLTVVGTGLVHDPRPILRSRLPSYPFVLTESTVIEFFSDPGITVLPGDLIGLTIMSDPSVGLYTYPFVNATGTRQVTSNIPLGGTINLSSPFTATLPPIVGGPALQVFIRVPPPTTDTTGDGIPDFVALSPEMQALGADPCRKTVAVQIDYMNAIDHTHKPLPAAIETVVRSFDAAPVSATIPCPYAGFPKKTSGINLIIDVKNAFPEQFALNFSRSEPQSFDTVKATFFDPNRVSYFHYGLFVHDLSPNPPLSISGIAELLGSDFIVSLGEWTNGVGTVNEQAGTLMHELGHNLGLDHGGGDAVNFKPNYLSVENYAFQVVGITSQTPSGTVTRFDYSSQTLPSLVETSLNETVGISNSNDFTSWTCPDGRTLRIGLGSDPLDWNCNGTIDTSRVSVDINNDTSLETLTGFNDWANLKYTFTGSFNFRTGSHGVAPSGKELTFPQARAIEAQWAAFLSSPITITTSTTLTADVTQKIVIGADQITLDCSGHTINGVTAAGTRSPSTGITLRGRHEVTIKNCNVTNFYIGFQLISSNGNTLSGNSATGNGYGFLLSSSNNNALSGNTASGNGFDGFLLQSSNNDNLLGDTANGNLGSGFRLVASSNNNLQKNMANNNAVFGFALIFSSNQNLIVGNAACGNGLFDAFQAGSTDNKFSKNKFCVTSGI